MNVKTTIAALITSAALAACGGSSPAAPASPSTQPSSARAVTASSAPASAASASGAAASAALSPAGSAAAGSSAPAAQGPIKIGLVEALTGGYAQGSKDNQDAFNLYLASINNTVGGRTIQTISADTNGKADAAAAKSRELVENEKVQMLAGGQYTPECYAIASYAKEAQEPFVISGSCGNEDVMYNPKFTSPYTVRVTMSPTESAGPLADYLVKQGMSKLILVSSDSAAGVQVAGYFAALYIEKGGSIVQEIYPPLNAADMGPYLTQLNTSTNGMFLFAPGADGLHFVQQLGNYLGANRKLTIADWGGTMASYVDQLQDKALGAIESGSFSLGYQSPEADALKRAWNGKYPGRTITDDASRGWGGAQFIVQAIKDANGQVENKPTFLNALYHTKVQSSRGPLSLDAQHDIVQNIYLSHIVKEGSTYTQTLIATYPNVSRTTYLSQAQIEHFPEGTFKGKWVGMTKDKLDQLLGPG